MVHLRRWPRPYRAALAVHSDADEASVAAWREIFARFHDAGIPATGSIFFWAPRPQASWFDDPEGRRLRDAPVLAEWARAGLMEAIHGAGDFNQSPPPGRAFVEHAFAALHEAGVRLPIWTNHGNANNVHNVLRWNGFGDLPGPHYLADLLRAHGIRFVWPQRLTHLIGQDRPCSPAAYYGTLPGTAGWRRCAALAHPWVARRVGIEPFDGNELVQHETLRDGTPVVTFRRCGAWKRDGAPDLAWLLAPRWLDRLIASGGASIVYVHLARGWPPPAGVFEAIARRSRQIWLVPAARLLRYVVVRQSLRWRAERDRVVLEPTDHPVLGRIPTADDVRDLALEDALGRPVEMLS